MKVGGTPIEIDVACTAHVKQLREHFAGLAHALQSIHSVSLPH